MYEFIPDHCSNDLDLYVRRFVQQGVSERAGKSIQTIRRMLFSVHGFEALKEKKIRRVLIRQLPEKVKVELMINLKKDVDSTSLSGSDYTLALAPWRTGSKVLEALRVFYEIPDQYLPSPTNRKMVHQLLQPIGTLGSLFDYQQEVRLKINKFLSSAQNSTMVQLPTGSGKTRTCMSSLVDWLKRDGSDKKHVLWLAHTQELCIQASDAIKKNWLLEGNQELEMVELWGDATIPKYTLSSGFWVIGYIKFINSIQKLMDLGLGEIIIVVDEAHKAMAPKLLEALNSFNDSHPVKLIGLSATPGRAASNNVENKQLSRLFSNSLISSLLLGDNPISELQNREILAPIRRISIQTECDIDIDSDDLGETSVSKRTLQRLAQNQKRNKQIISCIHDQVNSKRKVIVFACSVNHARELSVKLAESGIVACAVDCDMSSIARKLALESFRKSDVQVMLNFGVFSTGLDVPDIGAVVITRPTTSVVLYSQMIGRGMRGKRVGGTGNCLVIDVIDNVSEYGHMDDVYNFFDGYWH